MTEWFEEGLNKITLDDGVVFVGEVDPELDVMVSIVVHYENGLGPRMKKILRERTWKAIKELDEESVDEVLLGISTGTLKELKQEVGVSVELTHNLLGLNTKREMVGILLEMGNVVEDTESLYELKHPVRTAIHISKIDSIESLEDLKGFLTTFEDDDEDELPGQELIDKKFEDIVNNMRTD